MAKTTLVPVVEAILARLQAVLGFPAERVLLVARDGDEDEPPTQSEQVLKVQALGQSPHARQIEGAGRNHAGATRRVKVMLWTRCLVDETSQDRVALLDPARGHFVLEHKLYDALLNFQPADGDGVWLVSEPIVPQEADRPRRSKKNRGWAVSGVHFDVAYVMDLDATYL